MVRTLLIALVALGGLSGCASYHHYHDRFGDAYYGDDPYHGGASSYYYGGSTYYYGSGYGLLGLGHGGWYGGLGDGYPYRYHGYPFRYGYGGGAYRFWPHGGYWPYYAPRPRPSHRPDAPPPSTTPEVERATGGELPPRRRRVAPQAAPARVAPAPVRGDARAPRALPLASSARTTVPNRLGGIAR